MTMTMCDTQSKQTLVDIIQSPTKCIYLFVLLLLLLAPSCVS